MHIHTYDTDGLPALTPKVEVSFQALWEGMLPEEVTAICHEIMYTLMSLLERTPWLTAKFLSAKLLELKLFLQNNFNGQKRFGY